MLVARVLVVFSDGAWVEAAAMQAHAAARTFSRPAGSGMRRGCSQARPPSTPQEATSPRRSRWRRRPWPSPRQVASPGAINVGLAALANALAERDPDQARALLHEVFERRVSFGVESANDLTQNVLVAARLQDWHIALDLAGRALPLLNWTGNRPEIAGVFNVVARAVVDQDPESAGVIRRRGPSTCPTPRSCSAEPTEIAIDAGTFRRRPHRRSPAGNHSAHRRRPRNRTTAATPDRWRRDGRGPSRHVHARVHQQRPRRRPIGAQTERTERVRVTTRARRRRSSTMAATSASRSKVCASRL